MGNVCKPTGTSEKLGYLGGGKSGTDNDAHEKEKVGMVQARHVKRRDETWRDGNVSAIPAATHMETAAKSEKRNTHGLLTFYDS